MRRYLCVAIGMAFTTAFFAIAVDAQATAASTASQVTVTVRPDSAASQPAAKVWTNEDLSALPSVAAARTKPTPAEQKTPAAPAKAPAKTPPATYYQQQISKLQAQLPPINDQIVQLQDALAGKPVETARKFGWQSPDDWPRQLVRLQKKRDDIATQIQSLEDQARHNGIPINSLP